MTQGEFDLSQPAAGGVQECAEADMAAKVVASREPCPCCGVRAALNPHVLDLKKIAVLRTMLRLHAGGDQWVRVEEGRDIVGNQTIRSEYCARSHAARLAWFGLDERKEFRGSLWRVTPMGIEFARGEVRVAKKILCRHGEVIWRSREQIWIHEVERDLDKAYWDQYPWSEIAITLYG